MRRREPGDRRAQLVEAALATLAETGIESFTLAEVARRANVSAALVVHYFGDRNRLIEATFRQLVERVTTPAMRALGNAGDVEARLRAFVLVLRYSGLRIGDAVRVTLRHFLELVAARRRAEEMRLAFVLDLRGRVRVLNRHAADRISDFHGGSPSRR